uniref:F-box protein 40 n=1 Tax=Cynoglossus semilaevis TaxID=244447 RepID=A0A3P8VEH5_CYNSE
MGSRGRQHLHCDSCYSRRCRTRVEASVSCALVPCGLLCGAVFHLCKEEEHLLLCPNVRVPCLNADHGCPLQMPRSCRAAHLQECPASVVCCSMEWNRWPAVDAHSHLCAELNQNLMQERESGGGLDLALALRDQDRLFHHMKMKKLFPELVRSVEEEEKEEERREEEQRRAMHRKAAEEKESAARRAAAHTWESFNKFNISTWHDTVDKDEDEDEEDEDEVDLGDLQDQQELTQEEREALARGSGVDALSLENFTAYESMFSMEMGGCREAGGRGGGGTKGGGKGLSTLTEEETEDTSDVAAPSSSCASSCTNDTVKRRRFMYGSLEPMKIITVRTFRIPTSFSARQGRIRNPGFYRRESKAVDTSDLGVALEEVPVWEEVQASLLCSLEKEQRGHMIAESICSDGLLQDEGTQTYSFLSAPFRRNTSLADLTADKPLELHLQLQVESVTGRHHKASSAFTFLCGHSFQRREYGTHYKNVHSDIQMGVNGWFEHRCPLSYLGCTYSQRRFQPSTHEASVSYCEDLGCFSLSPTVPGCPGETTPQRTRGGQAGGAGGGADSLSSLPYEVLCHVASFLDSLSLSQLALVSRLLRQVCSSLLQDRGMVTLHWEKDTSSHGGAKRWRSRPVWRFSHLFSSVDSWRTSDVPPMSAHLKVCPFYQTSEEQQQSRRVPLPGMSEKLRSSQKGATLVDLLTRQGTQEGGGRGA